ncbi:MAG TPA: orotidine-5'-phosphate decarboxylase [Gemmatimonadaceae bacterium]|nr:orotidine-5'-phosphate decarboxylase [Gemmatimonadaceae bacterium]
MTHPAAPSAPRGVKPPGSGPTPIVALDVPTLEEARGLVGRIGAEAGFYKVGLQLYTREGPRVVSWLRDAGKRVFLDLKLHDIPNTVRGAAASAAALGADLLTVHAIGGAAMVAAAVEGVAGTGGPAPTAVIAVTVLTSFDEAAYAEAIGAPRVPVRDAVLRLAGVAHAAGARGVVCAGAEASAVREAFGGRLHTLVPGLRPPGVPTHDQARVATPHDVVSAGATWVVVGRAVTAAPDPAVAYAGIAAALSA